jgi:ABC-type glycerol-3-phosphate transport system substrate-binding protein
MGIEIISELLPKNNAKFALMDVNNLRGGYIQVNTLEEMEAFLEYKDRLKEGMLCYVKEISTRDHMYQYKGGLWTVWEGQGGSGGGTGSIVIDTLEELEHPDYHLTGLIAFIKELDTLYYYNGDFWESFSRIYIQNTPPDDKGGIWIDTSENREHSFSNSVV